MKKLILMAACAVSMFAVQGVHAWSRQYNNCGQCCEYPCGECYCRYVSYQACPYYTTRCVEEKIPCSKTCYRSVPEYFQVTRCRYVPQYYCETKCRPRVECYQVPDCKSCYRTVCDQHCRYIPRYYWKRECKPTCCPAAPDCNCCPTPCCNQ
jgi:hypothetical protein